MDRLFVYSDFQTEEFGRKYFSKIIPRKDFLELEELDRLVPIICNMDNSEHGQDIENIEKIITLKGIDKKKLSIVVFDVHTDMYTMTYECGNWVRKMLNIGYDHISIVGVVDFTESDTHAMAYQGLGERVEFFTGPQFLSKKFFKGYDPKLTIVRPLNDFYERQLRENTIISLDCDVSREFSKLISARLSRCFGRKGKTKVDDLLTMIESVKKKSKIIGQTVYGTVDSFEAKEENVYRVMVVQDKNNA